MQNKSKQRERKKKKKTRCKNKKIWGSNKFNYHIRVYVPSKSPTWKREAPAHLLRDSDSEEGIFHALVLLPTMMSLASMREIERERSNMETNNAALCESMVDANGC